MNPYAAIGTLVLILGVGLLAAVGSMLRQRGRRQARAGKPAPRGSEALHAQGYGVEELAAGIRPATPAARRSPVVAPGSVTNGVAGVLEERRQARAGGPGFVIPEVPGLWAACPNPSCRFDRTQVLRRTCPTCATELVPTGRSPRVPDEGRHRDYREDDTDTTAMTLHDLRPIERRIGDQP
jgi:hypothetical protein